MMQPDLLGYALNALGPEEQAAVEVYLRTDPDAQSRLDHIRAALDPLSCDGDGAPPPGLADRTLACVEAHSGHYQSGQWRLAGMPWRRVVEVAAALLLTATAVGAAVSWIGRNRLQDPSGMANAADLVACKNNLRQVFVALRTYSDMHDGQLPNVSAALPASRAAGGTVFSILHDNSLLTTDIKTGCPAAGCSVATAVGVDDIVAMSDAEYRQWAQTAQTGYAYALGYRQGNQLVGLRLDDGKPTAHMPLMADSSPSDPLIAGPSVHHGGAGQNVLYCDGHVTFCQSRYVGYELDDIYISRDKKVAAGVDWTDSVLASGSYAQ